MMEQRNVAIFAEGSSYTDLRGRVPLTELWRDLCAKLSPKPTKVKVFGMSKAQVIALSESQPIPGSREALDVYMERILKGEKFDFAILAFDGIPQNQLIPSGCMRSEVNFILEHVVRRKLLSGTWVDAAEKLLEHYANHPGCPRGIGRPPRVDLDILYMDPMFEGLLVADDSAVLKAVGLNRRPKGWPRFDADNLRPDSNILQHAVKLAHADIRRIIRGDMKSHKHDWALQIIRSAEPDSKLFQHPIAERLRILLA